MIQNQIKLPMKVALTVVMQGIRIRFGRSVVTVLGVVLGIAFLMAILTGQVVRRGVSEEEQLRTEVRRMYSFLMAEMGPAGGRTIGLVQTGPLSIEETRLLAHLGKEGLKRLNWAPMSGRTETQPFTAGKAEVRRADIAGAVEDATSIIVAGEGLLDAAQWEVLRAAAGKRIVCVTREELADSDATRAPPVSLGRVMRKEEIEKMEKEATKENFRNIWIVIISLVVTVIGISNAMLMSVTERFREIGTMKCLGALSRFIRVIFLIEASIMGVSGAIAGSVLGAGFSLAMYSIIYGYGLVFESLDVGAILVYLALSLVAGVGLSIIAAIYPASVASGMVPADALRSNI